MFCLNIIDSQCTCPSISFSYKHRGHQGDIARSFSPYDGSGIDSSAHEDHRSAYQDCANSIRRIFEEGLKSLGKGEIEVYGRMR